jgi:putative hydrolase of the HAD superfamily
MGEIRALFWDVGGVLLSNAWDREQRNKAVEKFHLPEADFQARHEMVVSSFERGKISLDEYLDLTVFHCPCSFSREAVREYVFSLSQPHPETIALARQLAASGKYLMATINNESKDLNLYRIRHFGLLEIFSLFVSSCFVGLRKPEAGIYRLALEVTQRDPKECCFIDDRPLNLENAERMGMRTIHMENTEQLRRELAGLGVKL